jgi:hypothetical protein
VTLPCQQPLPPGKPRGIIQRGSLLLLCLSAACTDAAAPGFEPVSRQASSLEVEIPIALGKPLHAWDTKTGGATWVFSKAVTRTHRDVLAELPGTLLVAVKRSAPGFGYRFDQDSWDPSTDEYSWFAWDGTDHGTPTNLDDLFQIYGELPGARFLFNVPIPRPGAVGFAWQTPEFYAAEAQYLFGEPGAASEYASLATTLDFPSQPPGFNWANLRARRGRVAPYPVDAIILGEEPYYIEEWAQDGAGFGARCESYRAALRARGLGQPYAVHVSQLPPTDPERPWFGPMFDALDPSDPPAFLDLYHYYTLAGTPDWERSFPVASKQGGFENWWIAKDTWKSDYTRFFWLVEDTRLALQQRGMSPDSMALGWSEHGIRISTQGMYNNMAGALHWATWLAETMRTGTAFDSMWVLGSEGGSTALVQVKSGLATRTPAFHLYALAKAMQGMTVLETASESPLGDTTDPGGGPVQFPWLVVRALQDGTTGDLHLFAINQHPTDSYVLRGLQGWSLSGWFEVRGDTYDSENPLGQPGPGPVTLRQVPVGATTPLSIQPVSIAHLVLTQGHGPDAPAPLDASHSDALVSDDAPSGVEAGAAWADAPADAGCGCAQPRSHASPAGLWGLALLAWMAAMKRLRLGALLAHWRPTRESP